MKKNIVLAVLAATTLVLSFILSSTSLAFNQTNNSTVGSSGESQFPKIEPAPPENPKGTADNSTGSITLSWKAVTSATGYNIYRSESASNGTFTKLDSVKDASTYIDKGLEANTRYYYQVTAVDSSSASESLPSNTISVMLGSKAAPAKTDSSSAPTATAVSNTSHSNNANAAPATGSAASSKAHLIVSPNCGPLSGFSVRFKVNGLAPDSIVMWRLVHYGGPKTDGPWGTFATNSTGGFDEFTFIEDLPKDKYRLYFFNSVQDHNSFNPSNAAAFALIALPCGLR